MKKSFSNRLALLGLSAKKELIVLAVLNLALIAIIILSFVFLKQVILIIVGLVCLLILNYFYLSRYSDLERKMDKDHADELISLLTYFEIFISNKKNVYTSLQLLLPYCSPFMEDAISTLLGQIDSDKSVQPYVYFASKFSNKIIESLMLSIYQMVDNGECDKQFDEFDNLFSTISREYHNSLIENKKKSLETFNSFPLFGAGAIVIVLTLCILTVVGDMVNVV